MHNNHAPPGGTPGPSSEEQQAAYCADMAALCGDDLKWESVFAGKARFRLWIQGYGFDEAEIALILENTRAASSAYRGDISPIIWLNDRLLREANILELQVISSDAARMEAVNKQISREARENAPHLVHSQPHHLGAEDDVLKDALGDTWEGVARNRSKFQGRSRALGYIQAIFNNCFSTNCDKATKRRERYPLESEFTFEGSDKEDGSNHWADTLRPFSLEPPQDYSAQDFLRGLDLVEQAIEALPPSENHHKQTLLILCEEARDGRYHRMVVKTVEAKLGINDARMPIKRARKRGERVVRDVAEQENLGEDFVQWMLNRWKQYNA